MWPISRTPTRTFLNLSSDCLLIVPCLGRLRPPDFSPPASSTAIQNFPENATFRCTSVHGPRPDTMASNTARICDSGKGGGCPCCVASRRSRMVVFKGGLVLTVSLLSRPTNSAYLVSASRGFIGIPGTRERKCMHYLPTSSVVSWHYPCFFVYWVKRHGQGTGICDLCGRAVRDARARGSCRTDARLLPRADAVGGSQERRADGGAGGAATSWREASVDASLLWPRPSGAVRRCWRPCDKKCCRRSVRSRRGSWMTRAIQRKAGIRLAWRASTAGNLASRTTVR